MDLELLGHRHLVAIYFVLISIANYSRAIGNIRLYIQLYMQFNEKISKMVLFSRSLYIESEQRQKLLQFLSRLNVFILNRFSHLETNTNLSDQCSRLGISFGPNLQLFYIKQCKNNVNVESKVIAPKFERTHHINLILNKSIHKIVDPNSHGRGGPLQPQQ